METIYPICCGLDVHQASVSACLRRVRADGTVSVEAQEFSTTVKGLTALADWLVEEGCPIAALESTGVYWKPVWHILSPLLDVWVLNARDVKQRRGKRGTVPMPNGSQNWWHTLWSSRALCLLPG